MNQISYGKNLRKEVLTTKNLLEKINIIKDSATDLKHEEVVLTTKSLLGINFLKNHIKCSCGDEGFPYFLFLILSAL